VSTEVAQARGGISMTSTLVQAPGCALVVGKFGNAEGVWLSGELDVTGAALLRDALAGLAGSRVVVDLSALRFVDAAGMSVLALAARRHPERLTVRGAHGLVRRAIDAGGLAHLLEDAAA
jgi:anti-anti-sigma factor